MSCMGCCGVMAVVLAAFDDSMKEVLALVNKTAYNITLACMSCVAYSLSWQLHTCGYYLIHFAGLRAHAPLFGSERVATYKPCGTLWLQCRLTPKRWNSLYGTRVCEGGEKEWENGNDKGDHAPSLSSVKLQFLPSEHTRNAQYRWHRWGRWEVNKGDKMDEYTEGDRECNIMNKLPTSRVQLRLNDDWQKKYCGMGRKMERHRQNKLSCKHLELCSSGCNVVKESFCVSSIWFERQKDGHDEGAQSETRGWNWRNQKQM